MTDAADRPRELWMSGALVTGISVAMAADVVADLLPPSHFAIHVALIVLVGGLGGRNELAAFFLGDVLGRAKRLP